MKKFQLALTAISAILLASCAQKDPLVGTWVQPIKSMPGQLQGFELQEDGQARSVNMATLDYEAWARDGDQLRLSGKSIGNHQTLTFNEVWTIDRLTDEGLILKKGDNVQRYEKATDQTVVSDLKTVKGTLILGHETRSFIPEGSCEAYWIVDKTGKLYRDYDKLTKGVKNGTPLTAQLRVKDMGPSKEGFAATYKSVWHVYGIDSLQETK